MNPPFSKWICHYQPIWTVLLLLVPPWLVSFIDTPAPTTARQLSGTHELNVWADISFALMTFWLWALTTSFGGRSIRSAGENKYPPKNRGGDGMRKAEFWYVILFGLLTASAYLASVIPGLHELGGIGPCVAMIFPFFVLRTPP